MIQKRREGGGGEREKEVERRRRAFLPARQVHFLRRAGRGVSMACLSLSSMRPMSWRGAEWCRRVAKSYEGKGTVNSSWERVSQVWVHEPRGFNYFFRTTSLMIPQLWLGFYGHWMRTRPVFFPFFISPKVDDGKKAFPLRLFFSLLYVQFLISWKSLRP